MVIWETIRERRSGIETARLGRGRMRTTCKYCGRFMTPGRTKPKVYCRTRCRVAAYRRRIAQAQAANAAESSKAS